MKLKGTWRRKVSQQDMTTMSTSVTALFHTEYRVYHKNSTQTWRENTIFKKPIHPLHYLCNVRSSHFLDWQLVIYSSGFPPEFTRGDGGDLWFARPVKTRSLTTCSEKLTSCHRWTSRCWSPISSERPCYLMRERAREREIGEVFNGGAIHLTEAAEWLYKILTEDRALWSWIQLMKRNYTTNALPYHYTKHIKLSYCWYIIW